MVVAKLLEKRQAEIEAEVRCREKGMRLTNGKESNWVWRP
jgi:hypothetical protein